MRVIRKILLGLGVLFLVIIACVTWLGTAGRQFRIEQTPFVETFVTDLSKHWDTAEVRDRLADNLIEDARTPDALQFFQQMKQQLGELRSARDFAMQAYKFDAAGRTGTVAFKGTFDNGEAEVEVTIRKKDSTVRVIGFNITDVHMREGVSRVQT